MIYVNGDSYTAKPDAFETWPGFLHKDTINDAVIGSTNDRIIRSTLDAVNTMSDKIDKVIIGFSYFTREEIYHTGSKQLETLDKVVASADRYKNKMAGLNINEQFVHNYTKIYMLAKTLKSFGLDYLFFSAAPNQDWFNIDWNYIKSLNIFEQVNADPNIINLIEFSLVTWAQDNQIPRNPTTGHLKDAKGHKQFADYLQENYNV